VCACVFEEITLSYCLTQRDGSYQNISPCSTKLVIAFRSSEYIAQLRQECHNSKFGIFELLV